MTSEFFDSLSDDELVKNYAMRTARLLSLKSTKSPPCPPAFIKDAEKAQRESFAECERRRIPSKRLKGAADKEITGMQAKDALEHYYEATVAVPVWLPYVGKETKRELQRRIAKQIIDGLTRSLSDPMLMDSMLKYTQPKTTDE